jgi:hypothetical protein
MAVRVISFVKTVNVCEQSWTALVLQTILRKKAPASARRLGPTTTVHHNPLIIDTFSSHSTTTPIDFLFLIEQSY